MKNGKMGREQIGAEQCYLALLVVKVAAESGNFFKSNKEFKRWLMPQVLLRNDIKVVGIKGTKRIFWLLSTVNGFIKRENKKIIITKEGYKFLWADEFKKPEIFKKAVGFSDSFLKKPRYKSVADEIKNKNTKGTLIQKSDRENNSNGFVAINVDDINPKKSQGGLVFSCVGSEIHESEKHNSSAIYMEVNVCGDVHRYSKTSEIYYFDSQSGKGFVRARENMYPVGPKTVLFIPAGMSHYLIPSAGEILKVFVVSPVRWESEEEFIRGREVKDSATSGSV